MFQAAFLRALLVVFTLLTAVLATPTGPPPAKRSIVVECALDCPNAPSGYELYEVVDDPYPAAKPSFQCIYVTPTMGSTIFCYYNSNTGARVVPSDVLCPAKDATKGACTDVRKKKRGIQERFAGVNNEWEASERDIVEDAFQPW